MKKLVVVLFHLGFWFIIFFSYGSFYEIAGSFSGDGRSMWSKSFLHLSYPGFIYIALVFYIFYLFLTPRYLVKNDYKRFIGFGILCCLVLDAIVTIIMPLSGRIILDFHSILLGFAFAIIFGVLGVILKVFVKWFSDKKEKEELEKKNLQTELALLKSQISPHFLFNTLNNIDVLITKDSEKASVYIKKLSDILRFMLYETKGELIPMSLELEYIKKYIELQKIRTSNDSFVSLNINGEADELNIAPMIFIPFIENAFKHSTNKKSIDAIKIQFDILADTINFRCENLKNKSGNLVQKQSGLGINLIEQRLNLLYKDKHVLKIKSSEEKYSVFLTIQINEN